MAEECRCSSELAIMKERALAARKCLKEKESLIKRLDKEVYEGREAIRRLNVEHQEVRDKLKDEIASSYREIELLKQQLKRFGMGLSGTHRLRRHLSNSSSNGDNVRDKSPLSISPLSQVEEFKLSRGMK